jgi:pyruvate,water dikinase
MSRVNAIVTEVGGVASHMATLAREYRVPALSGIAHVGGIPAGSMVTVDATAGAIYEGVHDELLTARSSTEDLFDDMPIFRLFNDVLRWVSPLNLLRPGEPNFEAANCKTYHDITRFIHQKAMEEMFYFAKDIERTDEFTTRLESDIPLRINIICMDPARARQKTIKESELSSRPMTAFWSGVKTQGWPPPVVSNDVRGFMGVLVTTAGNSQRQAFSDQSFAILSEEYMLLSLRMGYHFTTIEAVCTEDDNKNYIRFQYKEGGAALDRRVRRINLITEVLTRMGFEHNARGDFLDSTLAYVDIGTICDRLHTLGRLNMLTKQLDMALSNDEVARWYTTDIMTKLGLLKPGERRDESDSGQQ